MTSEEHYAQAERLLAAAADEYNPEVIARLVSTAQVHAILATITTPPLGGAR